MIPDDDFRAETLDFDLVNKLVIDALQYQKDPLTDKPKKLAVACYIYDDYDNSFSTEEEILNINYNAEIKFNQKWLNASIQVAYIFAFGKVLQRKIMGITLESSKID